MPNLNNIKFTNLKDTKIIDKPSNNKSNFFYKIMQLKLFKLNESNYNWYIKILIYIARILTFALYFLFFIIYKIIFTITKLCKQNKYIKITTIIILTIGVVWLIDFIIFFGKIYPGIYVGDIDLSWKTPEEATSLINETYATRLSSNNVTIFANEENINNMQDDNNGSGILEELSIEQAKHTIQYWNINSEELEAHIPTDDIVNTAINSTRGLNNIFLRLSALIFRYYINPWADYNHDALMSYIDKINGVLGAPVINPTCVIEDGAAIPKEGSDGYLLNNDEFINQLNNAFFQKEKENCYFVPKLYNVKQQISFQSAQILSEKINNALNSNVFLNYKDNKWKVDRLNLCKWLKVGVSQQDIQPSEGCSCSFLNNAAYYIYAYVNSADASLDILSHTKKSDYQTDDYSVQFINKSGNIIVETQGNYEIPSTNDAVDKLNNIWLKNVCVYENNRNNDSEINTDDVYIEIESKNIPKVLSYEEALSMGVISLISTYTTTYTSGSGTENRNNNIKIASNAINNSICKSNNYWSFNETVGDTTIDKGYLEAGSITANKYTKSVGGGVCQVATTVFNAVYDSGLEIYQRYNHDLHIASYPAGRDAAINYPDLDLAWKNDMPSDVLMTSSTTGYSITVNIIGVNPNYSIKTEVGDWTAGEHYKQEFVVDPSKEPNSNKVQTSGSDGKSIIIIRYVYNKNGELVRRDEFKSNYKPKTEIVVLGPGDEANKLLAEHKARMKDETDNW